MDAVHNIIDKPWISQQSLDVSKILEQWNNLGVQQKEMDFGYEKKLTGEIDTERKRLLDAELEKFSQNSNCRVFTNGNTNDASCLLVDDSTTLNTYRRQLEHAKRLLADRTYKLRFLNSLKYTRQEVVMRHLAFKPIKSLLDKVRQERREAYATNRENENDRTASSGPKILALLTVQIWVQPERESKPKLERELLIRSDQTLDTIRSHFKCVRDFSIPMDLSNDPETIDRVVSGELYTSGFFLIEDTFYNDMRQPSNTDLSQVIIDWASQPERGIGPFHSKRMEETKIQDLSNIRLGHPYLYQHQGNCEHLFTFSDLQLVNLDDLGTELRFPLVTGTILAKDSANIKCYMCHKRAPHWFTRFNDRLPEDPFFFCERCFLSFNYDQEKRKIGHFKAYPFIDVSYIPESVTM